MSLVKIPPAPRISLVDENRNITRPWSELIDAIIKRIGGVGSEPTNAELADLIEGIGQSSTVIDVSADSRMYAIEAEFRQLPPQQQVSIPDRDDSGRISALEAIMPADRDDNGRLQAIEAFVLMPTDRDDNGRLQALEAEVASLRQLFEGLTQGFQV